MELQTLYRIKPSDLPAPPQTLMAMLQACAQENFDHQKVVKLAQLDPLLAAELLRIVNSAFFGLSNEIKNVARAIAILGQRSLRNIVLCLAVKDLANQQSLPPEALTLYWEQSLRRAAAARLLAEHLALDPEECFALALMADMGLLVLIHLQPQHAKRFKNLLLLPPPQRLYEEQKCFGAAHDETGDLLAKQWHLPAEFIHAIGHHHIDGGAFDIPPLTRMITCCDWIAVALSQTELLSDCFQTVQKLCKLQQSQINDIFRRIPGETERAAHALGLHIHAQPDMENILQQANARLAEENVSYQELTWQLQQTIRERDRLAAELDHELRRARDIQQSLLPPDQSDGPCYGATIAARTLSGDFYDFFTLPDGRILFNLADVSGKGVVAALLMAKTCSLFRCLGKLIHEPAKLLSMLNREIFESTVNGMHVSMVAGCYNPETDTVTWVNAGHPPPVVLNKKGDCRWLSASAPPLGILEQIDIREQQFQLQQSCLICYSDGLIETKDKNPFELKSFAESLHTLRHLGAKEKMKSIIHYWKNKQASHDDMTVLLLETNK